VKIAHIVPPDVLGLIAVTDKIQEYSLLLPKLMSERLYRSFYRDFPGLKIMDNGVAEGAVTDFTHQRYCARVMNCAEMVLPDVMGSMDSTLKAVGATYEEAFLWRTEYQYMLVAQGTTVSESISCAERALQMYPGIINRFGVPRHIISQGPTARARIVEGIRRFAPHHQIHLLGTHPAFATELFYLSGAYKELGVRGCDTSLAWNAALCGVPLQDPTGLYYTLNIRRQHINAFVKARVEDVDPGLLIYNMETLNRWAS
jgi:hypothetical protein